MLTGVNIYERPLMNVNIDDQPLMNVNILKFFEKSFCSSGLSRIFEMSKGDNHLKIKDMKTYDVHFNDSNDSSNKGFRESFDYCKNYIETYNGTNESYFEDYKGGTASIVCNETEVLVYSETIK